MRPTAAISAASLVAPLSNVMSTKPLNQVEVDPDHGLVGRERAADERRFVGAVHAVDVEAESGRGQVSYQVTSCQFKVVT